MEQGKAVFEAAQKGIGHASKGLAHIKWEELPSRVKEHITNDPKTTAFQLVMLLVTAVPGLVVTPVLGAIGFSSIGPLAGG